MDAEDFVHVIREVVRDSAASGVLSLLSKPPGRRPREDLLKLSAWYESLDTASRSMLAKAVEMAADDAVYGFLCVIDGVRQIESGTEKGKLSLVYEGAHEQQKKILSNSILHEIYKGYD